MILDLVDGLRRELFDGGCDAERHLPIFIADGSDEVGAVVRHGGVSSPSEPGSLQGLQIEHLKVGTQHCGLVSAALAVEAVSDVRAVLLRGPLDASVVVNGALGNLVVLLSREVTSHAVQLQTGHHCVVQHFHGTHLNFERNTNWFKK